MDRRRVRRAVLSIAVALITGVVAMPAAAQAAATTTVALWNMNEPPGASTMHDSSGHGLGGSIGSDVQTGVVVDGATGFRFPNIPQASSARPQHLVQVPHDLRLSPGSSDYAVTIRYRTTHSSGNVVQKGQGGAAGGYWKLELSRGRMSCLFKGSNGQHVVVKSRTALSDNRWHTVRCERTANAVTLTVDGVLHGQVAGRTGSITNNWELSIGGKSRCNQVRVSCDYFVGDIDFVRIQRG